MLYSNMIRLAMQVLYDAHAGMVDKGGYPYIFHPYHVAEQVSGRVGSTEEEVIVALLHDVVEDTDFTLSDLVHLGFSEEVVSAIDAITHRYKESYKDYIERVKCNKIARKVKIEDKLHNLDFTRLEGVGSEEMGFLLKRYNYALEQLQETK